MGESRVPNEAEAKGPGVPEEDHTDQRDVEEESQWNRQDKN